MDSNKSRSLYLVLLCFSLTMFHSVSSADSFHYNNILIGDRPAGLGGAYTAISDDTAGLYYNPAGIVLANNNNISGSMSALYKTSTTYKGALGGTYDWIRKSSVLLPNYFGVFQSFGKGKIGFSYAVTDSIQENQDQTFKNIPGTNPGVSTYIINYNNQDTTYNIGPSYARAISKKLSIGFTLYGHFRSQEFINNQLSYLSNDTDYEWINRYYASEEHGIRPVLGVMWEPLDKFSAGLTIKKIILLDSTSQSQSTCKGAATIAYNAASFCKTDDLSRSDTNNSLKRKHPLEIRTGLAYFPNESLLVSGDLSWHSATEAGLTQAKTSVINFAVGAEYYVNSDWALRTGIYSNYANTPVLRTSGVTFVQPEHVDMYGLSISMSHFSRNSELSFGLNFMYGSGKSQLFNPSTTNIATLQDVESTTFGLFLSASHSY